MMELILISKMALIKGAQVSGRADLSKLNRMHAYVEREVSYYNPKNPAQTFAFVDIYQDSSVNQYGLLSTLHKPVYVSANGDTILFCFRRIDPAGGSGRIGVAWSFDRGQTWNTAGNINDNNNGRYPSAVGFTSDGTPVCSWPELVGGGWGNMSIGKVGSPSVSTANLGTYRSIGYKIAPDTFAFIGFTAGTYIVYLGFYDAVNNDLIGPPIAVRDPSVDFGIYPYATDISGDSVYVVGFDVTTGSPTENKLGYFLIRKDGTTNPDPSVANFIDTLALYAFTIGGDNFNTLEDIDVRFTSNYIYVLYALQKNPAPYNDNTVSHILVLQKYTRTATGKVNWSVPIHMWVWAPWFNNKVQDKLPFAHQPKLAINGDDKIVILFVQWTDSMNSGCGTNYVGNAPKDIFYIASANGGVNWGLRKVNWNNTPSKLEDFVWPARVGSRDLSITDQDSLIIAYLTPTDGSTDIHCNTLSAGSTTGSYNWLAKEGISYNNGDFQDSLIIVDVSEFSKRSNYSIIGLKGQIKVKTGDKNAVVSLYNVNGSLIERKVGDNIIFKVNRGVYIVRINKENYKVVVQ
jgi:hypothetical protein